MSSSSDSQAPASALLKAWFALASGVCLLIAVVWGGQRGYRHWEERKWMRQAHAAFAQEDLRAAAMAAQRAYAVDPSSVEACRTLAKIGERQKDPEAVEWRQRAVALQPDSLGDRLAFAEGALRLGQNAIVADALAAVPAAQQNDPRYHTTAAHFALARNDRGSAEQHFQAAARLAPNEPEKELELAEFQLRAEEAATRVEGRARAVRWKNHPLAGRTALHLLIDDALRTGRAAASVEFARELAAVPEAPFSDRLLVLDLLQRAQDPAFASALSRLETDSVSTIEKAAGLITWLAAHGQARAAIDWSGRLAADKQSSLPVRLALADAHLQLRDWSGLQAMLEGGAWGRAEMFRLALQARAARETGDEAGCEKKWQQALTEARSDPERLNLLQMVAFQWHWTEKATAALWKLSGLPEAQREALQALYRHYAEERDTDGLYRTLSCLVSVMPDDPEVRNNFAQIALLLKTEPARAREIARILHQNHPHTAAFAATYACALFQAGDTRGALKIMTRLTAEQLKDPAVAAYYGVLLSGNGQRDEAAYYLALGEKAKLLPEEEDLVAHAWATLARQ